MSENNIVSSVEKQEEITTNVENIKEKSQKEEKKSNEIKFFKNCSASLKRFSILLFVINIFLAVSLVGVGVVVLGVYVGFSLLSLLALPIVTLLIILIVLARFVSALIYGFAEIVEKAEK
ncbi:MAG: hypothetical protein IJ025_01815 [Clostridia bacterium]|nr:hypothetical protein [Clostridia bacterium]